MTTSQVKIADSFTLALKENGTVWTFGNTGVSLSEKPTQVMVAGNELENIVDIGAGNKIMIALSHSGKVYTWGNIKSVTKTTETNEQTGDVTEILNDTEEKVEEPTEVTAFSNVIAVDSFGDNFYAVDSDGFAYIWGKGYTEPTKIDTKYKMADVDGRLLLGENGFAFNIDKPNEKNSYLNSIVNIAYAEDHLLFAKADGRVLSMGQGTDGQLGSGYTVAKNYANFVKTDENTYLENCYEVSSGNKTSMAVTEDGIAYVWGDNTNKKLGAELLKVMYATPVTSVYDKAGNLIGTTSGALDNTSDTSSENVSALPKFELVEAGNDHMAIADVNGYVYTIGKNTSGQLGLDDTKDRTNFTKIGALDIIMVPNVNELALGQSKDITICLGNSFNLKTDVAMGGKIHAFTANNKKLGLQEIPGVDNSSAKKEKDLVPNFRMTGLRYC